MIKYFYVLFFGMIGACFRYEVKEIVALNYSGSFPISTFLVNIMGSLMLAFFLTVTFETFTFKPEVRVGISVGLFGALTTFSTFVKEISIMLMEGEYILATGYGLSSILLGVFFAHIGIELARKKISSI